MAASRDGRQREAVAAALAAFKGRVGAPELLMHLAGRLLELGEVRAMYACAHDLAIQRGGNPPVVFHLANMLASAGYPGDALQLVRKVRAEGVDGQQVQWLAGLCLGAFAARAVASWMTSPSAVSRCCASARTAACP